MNDLEEQLENLETSRANWLLINLIGFCIWDSLRIVDSYVLVAPTNPFLAATMWLGWLIWIVGLAQLTRLGLKMKRTRLALEVLNDEFIQLNRLKAWRAGFIGVVFTQIAIIIFTTFTTGISGILAAEISIFVSVTTAIAAFLFYNRSVSNG